MKLEVITANDDKELPLGFDIFIKSVKSFIESLNANMTVYTHVFTDTEYYHNDLVIRCAYSTEEISARFVYVLDKNISEYNLETLVETAKKLLE